MKITADTNVLVRAVVGDNAIQAEAAGKTLIEAELVAVPLPCLCEFVWVLRKVYGIATAEVSAAIRTLLAARNLATNRPAVEVGLSVLDAGGDFADGVIAYEGQRLGGRTFVSFDRKAVSLLAAQGHSARFP